MDFVREMVSNKKIRYKNGDFNLDLTYITPRIIAMAYPASGFESLYRNKINDVSKMMSENHSAGFLVINTSNKKYDFQKFDNQVYNIVWPNHFPCPLYNFITAVFDAIHFLDKNVDKVIAIHCKAGKGRTGSLTCAILQASGAFRSIAEANEYYFKQRAVKVTLPSQIRYLQYFEDFMDTGCKTFNFKPKRIDFIQISTKDKSFLKGETFKFKFKDFANGNKKLAKVSLSSATIERSQEIKFTCKVDVGAWKDHTAIDILLVVRRKGMVTGKKLFRVNFSILKINDGKLVLRMEDVEKPKSVPEDLEITLGLIELADVETEKQNQAMFEQLEVRLKRLKDARQEKGFSNRLLNGLDPTKQMGLSLKL